MLIMHFPAVFMLKGQINHTIQIGILEKIC